MTEIDKIDRVLKFILNAEEPPKRTALEITNELELEITTKESIEILDKLTKDGYVIREIQDNGIAFYFSSFEGRLFFLNGGYFRDHKSKSSKIRKDNSITMVTIVTTVAMVFISYLNFKATDKANDNKEEVSKLNSKIEILTKSNGLLTNEIYKLRK